MATDDFQDIHGIADMGDDELKDLVLQQLREYPEIDVDLVEVQVRDGAVRLAGRVGTEQEVQQVGHVVTDVLGMDSVTNELVVDELVRGARSEAADDAFAEEFQIDPQLGGDGPRTSDTAQHLLEDTEAEQFGTHDMQDAHERGVTYEPPDRVIQEGITGREEH